MKNHLLSLESFGQSIWLDYMQRSFVDLDGLRELVQRDGVKGRTSIKPSALERKKREVIVS